MRTISPAAGILSLLLLGGCGEHQAQLKQDVAQLKQENQDLKARVEALEGKVEALTASLPDTDMPDDNTSRPSN